MIDSYTVHWIASPAGGGVFTHQRDWILAHDQDCPSLRHAWLPRVGGTTDITELTDCDTCDITFFWDGVTGLFDDCTESSWYFCDCCAKKVMSCPCGGDCIKSIN